ncbi:WD repeat-containing protein 92-like [Eurytemora carolleeae]|uniref:WD repeat-containing protein 92-like n=1 Tax=Eurytemora carolleeae TaxID=1294199 RepID=UPI000C766F5E|nr:WD repeat-containing protein 92-like [Eurytemora carolleeae]|eukprot:XP_023319604.1 WD repeat-containing protein 92-like [Eurytemora affinis]
MRSGAPQIVPYFEEDTGITLYSVSWILCSNRLVAAGANTFNKGIIQVYSLTKELKKELVWERENGIKAVTFKGSSLQDRFLAVGDLGGRIESLDIEAKKEVWGLRGHEVVNCIDGAGGKGSGAYEILSGGREGCVKVWDTRIPNKPVVRDTWILQDIQIEECKNESA